MVSAARHRLVPLPGRRFMQSGIISVQSVADLCCFPSLCQIGDVDQTNREKIWRIARLNEFGLGYVHEFALKLIWDLSGPIGFRV